MKQQLLKRKKRLIMMNENAKKINNGAIKVMANGVCLCPVCHKFFSVKNCTDEQMEAINKNGACLDCAPAEVEVEVPVEAEKPAKKVSAFKRVRNMIIDAGLNDKQIAMLMDKVTTQKATGIAYQFLKEADSNMSRDEQIRKYNKIRYAVKPIEINGKAYFMTNDIYEKNVSKFAILLKSIA
jgi:superfamily II helicase